MILIRSIIFIILSLLCSFVLEAQTIFKCCDGNNICYKNSLGKTIVRSKKYTIAFSDSISSIGFVGTRKGKVVCINNHGKELFEVYNVDNGPDYVSDGLFRIVGKDDKVGFADTCGVVVIPPVFSYATPFLNGVAKVTFEGKTQQQGECHYWKSDCWFSIKKAESSVIMRTPSNSFYFIQLFRDFTDEGYYAKFLLVTKNGQPAKNIILPSSEDIKNFSATIKQYDNKWCIIECQYGGGDNMYSRSFYFKCKDDDLYLYKCKAIGMHLVGDSYKKSSEKLKVQPISIMDFDTLPYLENTP